ncbi:hypothetical protein ERJ75_000180400 [Trypanosoma vivax]|nr:hypothetical protein ERJ75_000180400 [Trypanosoma vivax]
MADSATVDMRKAEEVSTIVGFIPKKVLERQGENVCDAINALNERNRGAFVGRTDNSRNAWRHSVSLFELGELPLLPALLRRTAH